MHKKLKKWIILALTFVCASVFSQAEKPGLNDIQKIIPLSPNTAAFARYGEIPVSNFTGTINLTVPIYTIKTNEFTVPIELSYHSGGNKVETIAPSVGLGWSLGTIPAITRSVNGIADEVGFFNEFLGLSARELNLLSYDDFRKVRYVDALTTGEADSEPDIFYFNILGKSGKFIFDQEQNKFVTLDESQIKITFNNGYFTVISEDGYEYTFFEREITYSDNAQTTTAWYVSKIVSPSKKEEIAFQYGTENQTFTSLSPVTKVVHAGIGLQVNTDIVTKVPISVFTTISSKPLEKITFNGGIIEFNKNTTGRLDLQGGFDLNNIVVKDATNKQIFKYLLQYKYIFGGSSNTYEPTINKWMILEKVKNISSLTTPNEYSFTYNESAVPLSRKSPAQDYWGYYNGANSNQDLIPTTFYRGIQSVGADRTVNPVASQFGILKKVVYPSGGYSEFDYESNTTSQSGHNLPKSYIKDYGSIEGGGPFTPGDIYTDESETFIINNPPELFLNGNNPIGGAYVNFDMQCYGCKLIEGVADANIYFQLIREATPTSPYKIIYINRNRQENYLENGTYKIKAYVSTTLSNLKISGFHVVASWKILDPNPNPNRYIGGLRVYEIRNYTAASQKPFIKRYKYTLDYNSELSSGMVFSEPTFLFEDDINIGDSNSEGRGCSSGICSGVYHRFKSYNNIQQITHSGSTVGYLTVFEESDMPDKTGVTKYLYTHATDDVNSTFPFPPSTSMELFRGQPREIWQYKKDNRGELIATESKEFEYSVPSSTEQVGLLETVTGVKVGRFSFLPNSYNFYNSYSTAEYTISTNKNLLTTEITTKYFDKGYSSTTKNYIYDSKNHLKLTSETTSNSTAGKQEAKYFYPDDPEMAAKPFRNELIAANRISLPIVTKSLDNGIKIAEQETGYKNDATTGNLLLPKFIYSNKGSDNINTVKDNKIIFDLYDNKGNILQYTPENGIPVSIIWGYNQTQPIAKIENALYSSQVLAYVANLQNRSNADTDNCTTATCKEQLLRVDLDALRTALPNAMVTTYTHDPLVGVTSITDSKGDKITYTYDSFGRLQTVKDKEGNILSENKYNYKQ